MPNRPVEVQWEVSTDDRFRSVVRRGREIARPHWGHSVHAEPGGLLPDYEYFYRFRVGNQISPIGRTRTIPEPGAKSDRLRFAYASCQNYQNGYFNALADLAQQDLDFVTFLGDYIYESAPSANDVRMHEGEDEPYTVFEYRNRYARYRTDADLQAAHAAFPWFVTLDDHEIDNNWAADVPQDPDEQSPADFRARRIAAFRAWYEHMPVRSWSRPWQDRIQIYRGFQWGQLARVHVLDTRQYRTDQATTPEQAAEPGRTMLGEGQKKWLFDALRNQDVGWNLVANQAPMNFMPEQFRSDPVGWLDPWDGYLMERQQLLDLFGSGQVRNPFVLTGDRHFTMACDLKADFDDPGSATVASEIVGTSISSGRDGSEAEFEAEWGQAMDEVEHWVYGDGRRGYVVCDLDEQRLQCSMRVTPVVSRPGEPSFDGERFVVESGRPGLQTG